MKKNIEYQTWAKIQLREASQWTRKMQGLHIQLLGKSRNSTRQQCERERNPKTEDKAESVRHFQV